MTNSGTMSRLTDMENYLDPETFDVEKFAESLVRDGREAIKWERKKLEWILEEQRAEKQRNDFKAA